MPWIKFIWHFEAENADIHYKLLPTDCIDVLLNLSGNILYETDSRWIAADPFHVNGLRSRHSYIHQTGDIRIFGISFYPFGLYPFCRKSLAGIHDEVVDLFELAKPLAKQLELAVTSSTVSGEIVENIKNALCQQLQANDEDLKKAFLIHRFLTSDYDMTIQAFCHKHGLHTKTFLRNVLCYTGYTPKALRSIRRFQVSGNQLVHENARQLSDVAYDNAFADQAHFTREFRRFSGVSPRTFQQEKITVKENVKYDYL
jgi:AraC-like DNA-binding protein